MYFLVYVSSAPTWFSASQLRTLLDSSRERNEREGITGLLLYKDGNFMQVLEGDETAVRALHGRIAADLRHAGMVTLDSGYQPGRQFADWRMAFFDLNAARGELPAGYSDYLDAPLTSEAFAPHTARCHELLRVFRQLQ